MEEDVIKTTPDSNTYMLYLQERTTGQTYSDWLEETANCDCKGKPHHD
jgi:hypothetical protein